MRGEIIVWASIVWHFLLGVTLLVTETALESSYVSGIVNATISLSAMLLGLIAVVVALLATASLFLGDRRLQIVAIIPQHVLMILSLYSLVRIMVTGQPPELDFTLPRGVLIPGLSFGALMALGHSIAIWKYLVFARWA